MSSSKGLIYERDYLCFFRSKYIGTATFVADPYIGDSFMLLEVNRAGSISEVAIVPDTWVLCTS